MTGAIRVYFALTTFKIRTGRERQPKSSEVSWFAGKRWTISPGFRRKSGLADFGRVMRRRWVGLAFGEKEKFKVLIVGS